MLKLFRHIRKDLMESGNKIKYFKYAIGEIFLVVIGILIALQINNWNTNKANEKEAYNQLLEVQKEILNNSIEFDEKGTYYFEKLRDVRRVFADTLTLEDYQNSRSLRRIMLSSPNIVTQNEAYNKLIQNANNLPDKYKPLITDLKNLYNHSRFENSYDNLGVLQNQSFDIISGFSESLYREDFDAYFNFLLTSKDYKNRLGRFSWTLDDLAPELVDKKYDAISLYNKMIALGFPDDGRAVLKTMYLDVTPKMAEPFIGSYTNAVDTVRIYFQNKEFLGYKSKYNFSDKLRMRDSLTLNLAGADLEFNTDKSEFYFLMEAQKPIFKKIP
ncbi:hypothetical protein ES692_04875 [Psychroserpens burtonensis]|uniref:Uncharacterized protein n=1 Tax=Psychroserpens burtonensis TaxID=49278 RepID=A0A5C7B970_9FLAO|nr:DUF6090 family protein [Psychroserpens burtonensis]TXE18788.1 hypothetical protein ES692_04875 [Psychroserpens burtonensis]